MPKKSVAKKTTFGVGMIREMKLLRFDFATLVRQDGLESGDGSKPN